MQSFGIPHQYTMIARFYSVALLVLVSIGTLADRPNLNKYSDAELWEIADLIALVRIDSGNYTDNVGFDLTATSLVLLKGKADGPICFSVDYPLLDAPGQLGSAYLVFLAEAGAGQFELISEIRSAVPIIYVEIDDDMAIRMNVPRKSDDRDWYSYEGSLWIIDCGRYRAAESRQQCVRARSIVEHVMNRIGGLKGQ